MNLDERERTELERLREMRRTVQAAVKESRGVGGIPSDRWHEITAMALMIASDDWWAAHAMSQKRGADLGVSRPPAIPKSA